MSDFYGEMQGIAAEVLAEFKQGVVTLTRTVSTPGAEPWDPPIKVPHVYALDAVVKRVEEKYIDGTSITATDNQITFAVPEIVPQMSDKLTVDGIVHPIKRIIPIPAAGTPVVYTIIA